MERVWMALAAFLGGILAALAGLWDSGEEFNARKFGASIIRSLFGAVVFAGLAQYLKLDWAGLFSAFLSGAGIDSFANRIGGGAGNSTFPLPAVKKNPTLGPPPAQPPPVTPTAPT